MFRYRPIGPLSVRELVVPGPCPWPYQLEVYQLNRQPIHRTILELDNTIVMCKWFMNEFPGCRYSVKCSLVSLSKERWIGEGWIRSLWRLPSLGYRSGDMFSAFPEHHSQTWSLPRWHRHSPSYFLVSEVNYKEKAGRVAVAKNKKELKEWIIVSALWSKSMWNTYICLVETNLNCCGWADGVSYLARMVTTSLLV